MASLTSSFLNHMSPRSLLDFFFPRTSSHAFRTRFLKVSHKSGASMLTSSFTLFLNLALVRFSFSFHVFLLMIGSLLTIFFRTFLFRSMTTSISWCSHGITFTSHTYFLYFSYKHKINFCFTSTCALSDFSISLPYQNHVFATHSSFSSQNFSNLLPSGFLFLILFPHAHF